MRTIFRKVEDHYGAIKVEDARKTIERLEKETKKKWVMDYSSYMRDDDPNFPFPIELPRGHCWIVVKDVDY